MIKTFGKVSALFAGMTLAACGGGSGNNAPGTGSVTFDLAIAGGQIVEAINLDIVCPGVNQKHVLNVVKGEVIASFGGLTPGACTVTLASQSTTGTKCAGTQAFTVVAGATSNVDVTLTCQGVNNSPNGAANIIPRFELRSCADDRIKKIYAIPSNLLLGESTVVQAEINPLASKGTPKYLWAVRNEGINTAQGTLAVGACAPDAASCQQFTCSGLGASTRIDTRTGLPKSSVFVSVRYEDDDCFDTEEVMVDCIQSSVCGDGALAGVEQCDDANTVNGDGCSSACRTEICGDNVKNNGAAEECDGTDVAAGSTCSATCKLVVAPPVVCGDNIVNQASEQCDGTATPAGRTCSATCTLVPLPPVGVCGDNVVNQASEECDGTATPVGRTCTAACKLVPVMTVSCGDNVVNQPSEECDGTATPAGRTCTATCTLAPITPPGGACNACIAALPDVGPFNDTVCQTDALCKPALTCLLANPTCWSALAPAACYCGNTQADIDACENPTFTPKGDCAVSLKAAATPGATNAEVLGRYFDPAFPVGSATIIRDAAFQGCKSTCF